MNASLWILVALVVLILLFGVYVLRYRKQRFSKKVVREIQQHWGEITALSKDHPEQAVLKADKLLDHALKKAGFSGTLGEKMKKARAVFSDNNGIWSAHKLRNRIAHEMNIQVSQQQAQSALKAFKRAFHDLGIAL